MKKFVKPIQAILVLMTVAAMSSCTLGKAAETTPTADINEVMTVAAATAYAQLTQIAGQASATPQATETSTSAPVTDTPSITDTPGAGGLPATATLDILLEATATLAPGQALDTPTIPIFSSPTTLSAGAGSGPTCLNSGYANVVDLTIPDGTVMSRGQKFTKIWAVANTGLCAWDEGFGFIQWAGDNMGTTAVYFSKNDQKVQPGGVVDISVDLHAPSVKGNFIGHWVMVSDTGQTFGKDFTVVIVVK